MSDISLQVSTGQVTGVRSGLENKMGTGVDAAREISEEGKGVGR
jgi:hypothetical protein